MSVHVLYDTVRFTGQKPNYEIFFHDSTGRVIGRCGKKGGFLGRKISSEYGEDTLAADLATPVSPAFFSVTVR